MHSQPLRLETFSLGRRLEGKGNCAAYQPVISAMVCSEQHSDVQYVTRVMLVSLGVVQGVPVFGAWMPSCCLEPILLLEQGVGDDELVLGTELQKQASVVIAVANAMFTHLVQLC